MQRMRKASVNQGKERGIARVVKTWKELSTEGETRKVVMLELHFVLLSRSTDFYRTMLRRELLCHNISSVCLSVTSRYRDNIGWNTSKIISRLNSLGLRYLFGLTQRRRSGATGTPTKLGWNGCGVISTKICGISETVQNMTNVTKKDQREVAYTLSIGTKINDLG